MIYCEIFASVTIESQTVLRRDSGSILQVVFCPMDSNKSHISTKIFFFLSANGIVFSEKSSVNNSPEARAKQTQLNLFSSRTFFYFFPFNQITRNGSEREIKKKNLSSVIIVLLCYSVALFSGLALNFHYLTQKQFHYLAQTQQ